MSESEKDALNRELTPYADMQVHEFVLSNPLDLSPDALTWAANQLHFYEKLRDKVPEWAAKKNLESPPTLSIEQSSSQRTAEFKARLVQGKTCVDLTGGMGIDSYFLSKKFSHVTYVEQHGEIARVARANFLKLGIDNINVVNEDALHFLKDYRQRTDVFYLDPARRNVTGGKVFFIEDCSPDVSGILAKLFELSTTILIKYAPMLDIKQAIQTLQHVSSIVVLAVDNDVKEVLYLLKKGHNAEPEVKAVHLTKHTDQQFNFTYSQEKECMPTYGLPQQYLYEPNAAVMKAGAFKSIAMAFNMTKIASNSHLYTSETLCIDFPGRQFVIQKTEKFNKKVMRKMLKGSHANVSCRNFPLKPDQLKQMLGHKDGGNDYLFFTQNHLNEKIVIFTKKTDDLLPIHITLTP